MFQARSFQCLDIYHLVFNMLTAIKLTSKIDTHVLLPQVKVYCNVVDASHQDCNVTWAHAPLGTCYCPAALKTSLPSMVVTVSHHPKQIVIVGGCMFSVLIGRSRLGIGPWNIIDASKGFWSKGS